jgi:hypothetical protein
VPPQCHDYWLESWKGLRGAVGTLCAPRGHLESAGLSDETYHVSIVCTAIDSMATPAPLGPPPCEATYKDPTAVKAALQGHAA